MTYARRLTGRPPCALLSGQKEFSMFRSCVLVALSVLAINTTVYAKKLQSVGITLGSLGNPFFVALAKGAKAQAKKINPQVKVTTVSCDYDLNKQFTQIDNFIAAKVDMILINAADPMAIEPAIKKAQAAGIVVVGVDVAAKGANATVQTNNVLAGKLACEYISNKLHGKGNIIIQNGPQVSAVIDRVKGCKAVLSKKPGIKILSDDQDGKGSRDGGMNVMQAHLTRFPKIDAVFAINDPQAIGSDLASRQLKRKNLIITSVDGAPDIEKALKDSHSLVKASASQDPYAMAKKAVATGWNIMNQKLPSNPMVLMPSKLITRHNIKKYRGWTTH